MSDDIIFELSQADVQFEQPDIIAEFTPEGKDGRSVHPMGQWSDTVPYSTLDLVSYQGASYIAMKNVPAGTLPTNTQYWMLNANVEGVEVIWGSITGELSDQEDLQQALDAKANTADLGDLASKDKVDYDTDIENKPELGDLASKDKVDYETDIDNLPELGDLASKDKVDYDTDIDNLPELGALADHDTVDYETEVENKPELGDLASKDKVDYETDIDNLPTLGDLAEKDKVDYESDIDNLPELGDLASKDKANWNTDIENVPQTFPPSDHNHDGRYYTKTETDAKLASKANSADVYTKSQTDELLDEKFDKDPDSTLTGSILSFEAAVENAIKDLTVEINPVQDLHGYSNPYPAGGGKNIFDISDIITTSQNGIDVTLSGNTISYSGTAIQDGYKSTVKVFTLPVGTWHLHLESTDASWLKGYTYLGKDVTEVVTDATQQYRLTLMNAVANTQYNGTVTNIQIEAGSSYTGYAPYSNICPILGFDEVNVQRTGKNLYNSAEAENNTFLDNNSSSPTYGQTVTATGYWTSGFISVKAGQTYYKSLVGSSRTFFYDKDKNPIAYVGNNGGAITAPSGAFYHRFCGETNTVTYNGQVMFNVGSTATSYEAPQIQTVTIDLDGTRYGGLLNVTTGEMTVTHGIQDLGQLTWNKGNFFSATGISSVVKCPSDNNTKGNAICSIYKVVARNLLQDFEISVQSDGTIVSLDSRYSDGATYKTAMDGVQFVYELASPISIQLSPEQVTTLIGQNNLWADSGDSTIILRTGAGKMAYQDSVSYSDLTEKPDPDDYYTKSEVESLINHSGVVAELDASGSIAEFETLLAENLSALKVAIEPVQDLHGYDAPYPAGGGKNLLDLTSITEALTRNGITATPNGDGTFALSGTAEQADINIWLLGNYDSQVTLFTLPAGTYTVTNVRLFNYHSGFGTVTPINGSAQYTFSEDQPITAVRVGQAVQGTNYTGTTLKPQIEKGSSATSWTPYSNVCPISGHSTATVTRTGKNLLAVGTKPTETSKDVTFTPNGDGTYNISGTASETVNWTIWDTPKDIPFWLDGAKLSGGINANVQVSITYYENGAWKGFQTTNPSEVTLSVPSGANGYNVGIRYANAGVSYTGVIKPMIRLSSDTDSTFEAPQIQQVTIALGSTVYGAQLDAVAGTLTVDRAMIALDNRGTWTKSNLYPGGFYLEINQGIRINYGVYFKVQTPFICSHAKTVNSLAEYLPGTCYCDNSMNIRIMQAETTSEEWGQYLQDQYDAGTPVQICGYLAAPTTVSLTPAQVQALVGKNYVWEDTGDVIELSYFDNDTNSAIDDVKEIIGDYTETMVAPRNLTANEFIVVNKHLFKVTANVASGSNLVIGTNVVETTVAEQLTYLLSQL